jgi:hypothetical protein
MHATQDLALALDRQAALRNEAAHDRLARAMRRHEHEEHPKVRRVFGLRLSLA